MLRQFIYMSSSVTSLRDWELTQIVQLARRNNARRGLTGVLIYAEGNFLQVLEGDYLAVEEAMERIAEDSRHSRLVPLIDHWVQKREFGEDSLAAHQLSELEVDEVAGCKRFFSAASGAGARKLLTGLRQREEAESPAAVA